MKHSKLIFGSLFSCIMLFSIALTATLAKDNWTLKSPSPHPSARAQYGMTSIGSGKVLLFGGWDGTLTLSSDTWIYDASADTWTQMSPATSPSSRFAHAMVYLGSGQVLLFGGFVSGSPYYSNETWLYDLNTNTWTKKNPATAPAGREYHKMAYIGGNQLLLFGGMGFSGLFNDTWVYDLSANNWTQMSPTTSPSARRSSGMSYLGDDKVLLFGGNGVGGPFNDTWIYDLSENNWTLQSPATSPSGRSDFGIAPLDDGRLLLFGGAFNGSDETWIYDPTANNWAQQSPSSHPSGRQGHTMANAGSSQMVVFGGQLTSDLTNNDETWLWLNVPNQPPVADAGTNQAVIVNETVQLDGSGSSDPDSDPLSYSWSFYSKPAGSSATLSSTTIVNPTFVPDVAGDYVVQLVVNDGTEDSPPDQVTITALSPQQVIENLIALVISMDLNKGLTKSLTTKLYEAIDYLNSGDNTGGIDALNSFINSVEAQAGKKLTNEQADQLIAEAQSIIDAINAASLPKQSLETTTQNSIPTAYHLDQNFPNPFNPTTQIRFGIPQSGNVTLKIYNSVGQLVKTLVDGNMSEGYHQATWDATDNTGSKLSSGVYIYRITAGTFTQINKMLLLK